MPSLQVVLLGLPGALQLVLLFSVSAFAFVVRRKWMLAAARREEIRRLVLLASEEAARAEIEATYEYRNRLDYEHYVSSTTTQPVQSVIPVCAVCYSPTTTRCSRCKAVKYCSGKCQIIHWRQGHKEECHPPENYVQSSTQESSSDPSAQQVESSNICDSESAALYANSNETTNEEKPIIDEDGLKGKHIPKIPEREHSSSSPQFLPASVHSSYTSPSGASVSVHDASAQDSPSRNEETYGTANVSNANTSEMRKRKLNKFSLSECTDANVAGGDISSLSNLKGKASDYCTKDVGCQSDDSSGQSLNDLNDCTSFKSTEDLAESQELKSVCLGHTDSTSSGVAAKEAIRPATTQKEVHRDAPSKSVSLKVYDSGTSVSEHTVISDIELLPKTRITGTAPVATSGEEKSTMDIRCSVTRTTALKVHPQLSGMAGSTSNGGYDLKSSVQRVVQQFKPSKISRNCPKMLSPYDIFVKLYNEKVEMHPSGLINCGNSCYANVVLQCLAFTRPLTSYLVQGLHRKWCQTKGWCFTCEFESLVQKIKQGQSPISPNGIISQIPKIGSHLGLGREEDAHEFLRCVIDAMHSVCLTEHGLDSATQFAEQTTLMHLTFGGFLRSKIKCMRCQSKSERTERMMDLTVEIHGDVKTLDEALTKFTMTEILDGENKYQCGRCKSYEKAKKRLKILEAPNVLTIVLKRFQSGKFGKLNKAVRFPEILSLVKYMSSGTSDKYSIYQLYAVVVHVDVMNAAFSGHYVCYVMNASRKWYKIDDSTVKPVEFNRVKSTSAYMLFYARCPPRSPSLLKSEGSTRHLRPQPNWVSRNAARVSGCDSSDASDSSSLFSFSDEGSCSTDSTRDSTSTDGLSDFIFGDHSNGSMMCFSEDSDSFSYSPLTLGSKLHGHLLDSPDSEYSAAELGFSGLEEREKGLCYGDYNNGMDTTRDGVPFLRCDSSRKSSRKLAEQHNSSSSDNSSNSSCSNSRDTDLPNPSRHKSVMSSSNYRDRTAGASH